MRLHAAVVATSLLRSSAFAPPAGPTAPRRLLSACAAQAYDAARGPALVREGLYVPTPLIPSPALSATTNCTVHLKLETNQPSGSFKDRGMAWLCAHHRDAGRRALVSSSGGNAGHAVASVGARLGMEVLVVVPTTTKDLMIEKIKRCGATVEVHGANWNAADERARVLLAERGDEAAYIHPFEHDLAHMGASTIVDEIAADPAFAGKAPPGAVAVSVGGAGLLCGVYEGLARHYPDAAAPDVLACETHGAASFAAGMQGRGGIDAIESIATSLGALEVVPKALALAKAHAGATELVGVSDAEAVAACGVLAREHRLLVEPACGAAAAVATLGLAKQYESLVIVVCGGSGVTPDILRGWEEEFLGNRYPT